MPQLVDCYCLLDSREKESVHNFLDEFVPERKQTGGDYFAGDDDSIIFEDANELIDYLVENLNEENTIYWESTDESNPYKFAMAFFTDDGKIIIGISVVGRLPDEQLPLSTFLHLKSFCNFEFGCITVEEPAPANSKEFMEFCKNRYIPPLV